MKAEAIRALELFKQQHLAKPAVEASNGQADMVSGSSLIKENGMSKKGFTDDEIERASNAPIRQKGVNFNYPDHYKPLKDRIMSALNNGARTPEAVATYCKEEVKLVNLQLGRWVSRGEIGRKVSNTGIIRFYPYNIAKEMGILITPEPINYYTKERRAEEKKRSSSSAPTQKPVQTSQPTQAKEEKYIEFLETRMVEWQTECRKMAKELTELKEKLSQSEIGIIEARNAPRNVTGEVAEVMQEVMELRATVAYLESKLFGGK